MEYETIDAEIVTVTDAAVLLDTCSGERWVPRSLIENGHELNEFSDDGSFEIAEWFVEKEGLY